MAQKAPKAPMNRRTTYQSGGARSTGQGSVVTTSGGGSTVTINPGAQPRKRATQARPAAAATPAQRPSRLTSGPVYRRGAVPAGRRQVTGRQAARGTRRAVTKVTERKMSLGSKHTLTVELIIGLAIVLVRVVADYEPQHDGTVKGKIGHPRGQYGPLPIAAGLIGTFFILSFFTAKGGNWARAANAFGALVVLTLGVKSAEEFNTVVATFPDWGKGKKPAGAWETSGTAAGQPVEGGTTAGAGGQPAPTNPTPQKPHNGKCPPGYTLSGGQCIPNLQQHPVEG